MIIDYEKRHQVWLREPQTRAEQRMMVELNKVNNEIEINNIPIRLTKLNFRAFSFLYEHLGQPVSPNELIKAIWPNRQDVPIKTLQQRIFQLKSQLDDAGFNEAIMTVSSPSKSGYELNLLKKKF